MSMLIYGFYVVLLFNLMWWRKFDDTHRHVTVTTIMDLNLSKKIKHIVIVQ